MEDGGGGQEQALARRRPKWLLVFCVVAILIVAVAAVFFHGPPEPVYGGIGLSKWLGGIASSGVFSGNIPSSGTLSGGVISSPDEVGSTLWSVGPEALPWLVNALPGLELRQRFDAWCLRTGRSSSPLINRLLLKLTDQHRNMAYINACSLLARLAPGTPFETKAFRAFVPHRPEDSSELINIRLSALGRCTNSPDKAIPILIAELAYSPTVDKALNALQNFGSLATPQLYPLALRETGMIRPAEVALERADPLAYKRLREEKEKRRNL